MSELLASLNPAQLEAVTYGPGPLLIFAGAGTGKTRVLTHRIAHLIQEHRVEPRTILAVTFTNKAAGEMRERVEGLLRGNLRGMWIGTFHAICARLLRQSGEAIGVPPDFTIYDTSDQEALMRDVVESLMLDPKDPSFKPRNLLAEISRAKNELLTPREYERTAADNRERQIATIYANYTRRLDEARALDFDDLIGKAVHLLQSHPAVAAEYAARFRHVLVDEYQDINYAQYLLVKSIAGEHRSITVVGDDDQSIYRWRGADVRLILEFEKDFPECRVVKLEQNYRSTQTVLNAAYEVIRKNPHRKDKKLFSDLGEGELIRLYRAITEHDEAAWVARTIREARSEGASLGDHAILFRTNAQSRALEEALNDSGIAYQLVGGHRFYDRKEIKDILAYLKVVQNPFDTVSLLRIINVPTRGIGPKALSNLERVAQSEGEPLLSILLRACEFAHEFERSAAALARFGELLSDLLQAAAELTLPELVRKVLSRSGYEEMLRAERSAEAEGRLENIRELATAAEKFLEREENGTLGGFLEHVALVSDVDELASAGQLVTLMTLHAAKGLEFGTVFLVGMEESLFPHSRSFEDPLGMEEERRLCYVGMTRAKRRLYLSHAHTRAQFGETRANAPSRFLADVPSNLLESAGGGQQSFQRTVELERNTLFDRERTRQPGLDLGAALSRRGGPATPTAPQARPGAASRPSGPATSGSFRPGERVRHDTFGVGTVVSVSAADIITVAFEGAGVKKLSLQYAKVEKAGR